MKTEHIFNLARPYWKAPFRYFGGSIWDKNHARLLDVRGWGHLTGQGSHALPDEQAGIIQDQLGEDLARLLNDNWK